MVAVGDACQQEKVCVCVHAGVREKEKDRREWGREREREREREHVVVIWLFYCLALVVKVLGRGYERPGSCQKPPESGYPDRPYWGREREREYSGGEREGIKK